MTKNYPLVQLSLTLKQAILFIIKHYFILKSKKSFDVNFAVSMFNNELKLNSFIVTYPGNGATMVIIFRHVLVLSKPKRIESLKIINMLLIPCSRPV